MGHTACVPQTRRLFCERQQHSRAGPRGAQERQAIAPAKLQSRATRRAAAAAERPTAHLLRQRCPRRFVRLQPLGFLDLRAEQGRASSAGIEMAGCTEAGAWHDADAMRHHPTPRHPTPNQLCSLHSAEKGTRLGQQLQRVLQQVLAVIQHDVDELCGGGREGRGGGHTLQREPAGQRGEVCWSADACGSSNSSN